LSICLPNEDFFFFSRGLQPDVTDEMAEADEAERMAEAMAAGKERRFVAHVVVPTQKEIEESMLRRKKAELMQMLAIEDDEDEEMAGEAKAEPESKSEAKNGSG